MGISAARSCWRALWGAGVHTELRFLDIIFWSQDSPQGKVELEDIFSLLMLPHPHIHTQSVTLSKTKLEESKQLSREAPKDKNKSQMVGGMLRSMYKRSEG